MILPGSEEEQAAAKERVGFNNLSPDTGGGGLIEPCASWEAHWDIIGGPLGHWIHKTCRSLTVLCYEGTLGNICS